MSQYLSDVSLSSTILLGVAIILTSAFILYPKNILRQLNKLRYQYEVTLGLYMLTPTEKFILNSIFLLVFSMVGIAACLYLPENISIVTGRALYYLAGDKFASSPPAILRTTNATTSSLAA